MLGGASSIVARGVNTLLKPFDLAIRRISTESRSPLPEGLQHEILHASRRLLRAIPTNQIDLLGYNISIMGERQFRFLFDEIFVKASYFFQASNLCPLIFDCGSNIGMSVLFFKRLYPNSRIVAFEPDPATFETLRCNVNQNRLSDVALHQVALADGEEDVELFRDASSSTSNVVMSTLRQRHTGPSVTVPARRLSTFISSEIDLLKVDVEGAEEAIMNDLVDTGALKSVRRLHLEYHHHIDASVDNLAQMLRHLEEHGFGYQLRGHTPQWPCEATFQDISIYAYRK